MRQFDVFRNPSKASAKYAPFLVVLQSSLTLTETTVVVAPLVLPDRLPVASRLFPRVKVGTRAVVLSTNELGAIGRPHLKERVGNLESERDTIIAAIDMLFSGF
ncbi:CcdB family protein [Hyphomicrobium sp. CS1GBMeth3]|uniref:CcdB family protein n=1 Tax=Hyphomicrobium sp. CS1GBMeth3 TaxID=1892845 RepID=UPI000930B1DC|nr:CcdB family protein [Hyphomicrobium sp. CS1GBMeth3]